MGFGEHPGSLGWVSDGVWEAIHADWPAYPGDRSWELALLRFGDFPSDAVFTCLSVIDQCALFVAGVSIKDPDLFSDRHMHVAVRLEELLELDDRNLVTGVEIDNSLSPDQILLKRVLGPSEWESVRSGQIVLGYEVDGEFARLQLPDDEESSDGWDLDESHPAPRSPERTAMYPGTIVRLTAEATAEVERIARLTLDLPTGLESRLAVQLNAGLFDSAIRDLGAALEMRMRRYTGSSGYGSALVEKYVSALLASGDFLPARVKSLRQELRAIFKFVRNEFAHQLVEVTPSRGHALVARMCWHIRDVEMLIADF
ncbi:MAG: hypothetical protein AB7L91_14455 [Dehalococcoidia bacterium]